MAELIAIRISESKLALRAVQKADAALARSPLDIELKERVAELGYAYQLSYAAFMEAISISNEQYLHDVVEASTQTD